MMSKKHSFKIDKLVRDKTLEIMRKSGACVHERIMGKDEYITRLKDKLLEEATEVTDAASVQEIQEELADLLETMMSIANMYNITFEDINQTAKQKRLARGGFEKRIYVDYVEIDSNHRMLEYYKAHKNKYPEMV